MPTTIITNAPADYDYGYVTQVGTVDLLGRTFRVVTMPADRITYQCGRYQSGMYIAAEVIPAEVTA